MVHDHKKFELKKIYSLYEFFKNDLVIKIHPEEQLKIRLTIDLNKYIPSDEYAISTKIKYLKDYKKNFRFLKLRNIFKSAIFFKLIPKIS
jgi:hypothetical protein